MKATPKLAANEELLPDGRILIRGTLRPDGTRRPDRYKKAGFRNDEDLQNNKYLTPGARRRLKQQQMQSHSQKSNDRKIQQLVHSVVTDIISNSVHSQIIPSNNNVDHKKRKRVQIDFNEDVLQPLIHEFYDGNKSELIRDTTQSLCRNISRCRKWIENEALRAEIIKHLHSVLHSKQMALRSTLNESTSNGTVNTVRGKGTISFGSGKLLSEQIEMKRNGLNGTEPNTNEHHLESQQIECKENTQNPILNVKPGSDRKKVVESTISNGTVSKKTKIKELHQECRAIRELEEMKANGSTLNSEQIAKIDSKEDVLNMLMNLKLDVTPTK